MKVNETIIPQLNLEDFVECLHGKKYIQHSLHFPWGQNGMFADSLSQFNTYYQKLPRTYVQDFYKIFALSKGNLVKLHQTKRVNLNGRSLYLSRPGQIKTWQGVNQVDGYMIAFSKDFLSRIVFPDTLYARFPFLSPVTEVDFDIREHNYREVLDLINKIHSAFKQKDELSYEFVQVWTLELLLLLKKNYPKKEVLQFHKNDLSTQICQRFAEVLEEHFIEGNNKGIVEAHGVSDFAEDLNMEPGQLNQHLQKGFGKNAKVLIMERYILAAKCKLLHTKASISEICYSIGFDNPSYFSRYFKRIVGMSPQAYRDKY